MGRQQKLHFCGIIFCKHQQLAAHIVGFKNFNRALSQNIAASDIGLIEHRQRPLTD